MIELMRFWFFSGILLTGAAWSLDTLMRGRGLQVRAVWAAAMGLTVLSPVLPRLGRFWGDGSAAPVVAQDTAFLLPDRLAPLVDPMQAGLSDTVVLGAWVVLSVVLLVAGGVVVTRLRDRSRNWRRARVSGEDVLVAPDFGPAVVGFARPSIVLPEALCDADARDLELILRHEREHIRARDPWLLIAAAAVVACMPWNLPVLWQASRLRAAVEGDCDLRVLRSGACRRTYGDLLVRMAMRPSGFGFAAAAMSERRSGLRRRLERLRDRRGQTRVTVTALLVIAGAGAMAVWMGMPSPLSHLNFWSNNSIHEPVVLELHAIPQPPELPPVPPLAPTPLEAIKQAAHERLEADRRSRVEELRRAERTLQRLSGAVRPSRIRITSSTRGSDPIIYVDGVRFDGDLEDLDPDRIERIEIVKGDAARATYGDIGTNGVINIFLKTDARGGGTE